MRKNWRDSARGNMNLRCIARTPLLTTIFSRKFHPRPQHCRPSGTRILDTPQYNRYRGFHPLPSYTHSKSCRNSQTASKQRRIKAPSTKHQALFLLSVNCQLLSVKCHVFSINPAQTLACSVHYCLFPHHYHLRSTHYCTVQVHAAKVCSRG